MAILFSELMFFVIFVANDWYSSNGGQSLLKLTWLILDRKSCHSRNLTQCIISDGLHAFFPLGLEARSLLPGARRINFGSGSLAHPWRIRMIGMAAGKLATDTARS